MNTHSRIGMLSQYRTSRAWPQTGVPRGPMSPLVVFGLIAILCLFFSLTEQQSLQFRAEIFNTFSHTNFSVPGITMSAGFGQIVSTATEARIIQLALKYRF